MFYFSCHFLRRKIRLHSERNLSSKTLPIENYTLQYQSERLLGVFANCESFGFGGVSGTGGGLWLGGTFPGGALYGIGGAGRFGKLPDGDRR